MMLNKHILAFITLLFVTHIVNAQYFNTRVGFSQTAAEVGWNVVENDSGYLMVGGTVPGIASIGIAQIDFNGNVLFQKTYMDTNIAFFSGFQNSLVKLTNGGYALFGGKVKSINSNSLAILFRFDSQGDTLWTKTYGDSLQTGRHMRQTPDGGFILLADDKQSNASHWVIKTDSLGNIEWDQHYGGPQAEGPGHIAVCNDGGYVLTGASNSLGAGTPSKSNIRVTKIDSLGNGIFHKFFGELGDDGAWAIEQTQDRGYIIGGTLVKDATTLRYPCAIKLDSLGDTVWTRTYRTSNAIGNGNDVFNQENSSKLCFGV